MKYTEQGRVTDAALDELEEWANKYPKPWTMGVGSYVMKALVAELRELRSVREASDYDFGVCACGRAILRHKNAGRGWWHANGGIAHGHAAAPAGEGDEDEDGDGARLGTGWDR